MIDFSLGVFAAAVLSFVGVLFFVLTAVLAKLSGDEVSGWLPVWSNRFLESAASLVAPEYQDRYREEWKAELAAFRDRRLSGLGFAWRLRRRAKSVNAALEEHVSLGNLFEPEPAPLASRPLDADTIAEIVRRVVERSRPRNQLRFEEIIEEMREILGDIDKEEFARALARDYVGDISEKRREARTRPSLPAMRPQAPLPPIRRRRPDNGFPKLNAAADWGSDYDTDWGFLQSERARAQSNTRRENMRHREATRATIGRMIRSWCRGEIRL